MENYIDLAMRTDNPDTKGITDRLCKKENIELLHACIGMETEAGELADIMKKHIFYGKEIDLVNFEEELGDLLWYIARAMKTLGFDFNTVMQKNITKLEKRYPDKFTLEHALNRDKEKELNHF